MLDWASANFDALGPLNAPSRGRRRRRDGDGCVRPARRRPGRPARRVAWRPGSSAAAERGDIDARHNARCCIIDYLAPSLDTTISALGNAVWLFATHPDQWELLRREPHRVKNAFNEVLRLESPINCFTRVTTTRTELGGFELPAGARVVLLYASANRDERRWDRPDAFDITREAAGHARVRLRRPRLRRHGPRPPRRCSRPHRTCRTGRTHRDRHSRPQAQQPDPGIRVAPGHRSPARASKLDAIGNGFRSLLRRVRRPRLAHRRAIASSWLR